MIPSWFDHLVWWRHTAVVPWWAWLPLLVPWVALARARRASYPVRVATVQHPPAMTAGTVQTVTLPVNAGRVEVVMKTGTPADVYFTTTSVDPAVAGQNSHYLPGVAGASLIVDDETPNTAGAATQTVVKLISAGTPSVSVRAVGQ